MINYIKKDYDKYFLPNNKAFNPKRNKEILEGTILKYEKRREEKNRAYKDLVRERVEAITDYLFSPRGAGMRNSIERYFGKTELARLRGEDILTKLRRPLINKLTK